LREVPNTSSGCNDELSTANDEGADPEEAKEMVNPYVSGSVIPFNVS